MKTINLTGEIGWEITDRLVNSLLPKDGVEEVNVVINSLGGDVFEAFAIFNTLKSYPGTLTTIIKSVAASAAGVVYLAGKRKAIYKNATFMAHPAWGCVYGNGDELTTWGKVLNDLTAIIADELAEALKKPKAEVIAEMKKDFWLVGWEQIVAAGLTDEVIDADEDGTGETSDTPDAPTTIAEMSAKVKAIQEKMKTENRDKAWQETLQKVAASIAGRKGTESSPRSEGGKNIKQEVLMTKDELKTKFPDLYNQIVEEGKGSVDVETAVKEAVENDRARSAEILDYAGIPGAVKTDVIEKIKNGIDAGEYAKAELKKINDARAKAAEEAAKNGGGLKSLGGGNQIPNDSKVEDKAVDPLDKATDDYAAKKYGKGGVK